MKKTIFLLAILITVSACAAKPTPTPTSEPTRVLTSAQLTRKAENESRIPCTAGEYKTQATAQMKRLQTVLTNGDLRDPAGAAADQRKVQSILQDINKMSCRKSFPLKQETLEYTARHMIDMFEAVQDDDLAGMTASINKIEANINAFYDWSFDMD